MLQQCLGFGSQTDMRVQVNKTKRVIEEKLSMDERRVQDNFSLDPTLL